MNAQIFVECLRRFRAAMRCRRHVQFLRNSFILHADNASSHRARRTRRFLRQTRTRTLEHPAHSPDLAPSDFWLFPRLKSRLKGQHFGNLGALRGAVDFILGQFPAAQFTEAFDQWGVRVRKCVQFQGRYFEGMQ